MPHFPPSQAFVLHWLAAVHVDPTAAAHVFVVALHMPAAQTTSAPAAHTPLLTPSVGMAAPGASFVLHASVDRSQYDEAEQSPSAQQPEPPLGTQRPLTEHVFETHWEPAVHELAPAPAHVFVVTLHSPVAHAELVACMLHVSWSVSAGSAAPAASLSVHVNVLRAQKRPAWQSESAQQDARFGTQAPESAHELLVHAAPLVQAVPFTAEHVAREELQAPVAHTAAAFAAVHVPSWRPSLATATPAASFARHANALRSQNCEAVQSPSTWQEPATAGMHTPPALHAPEVQRAAAFCAVHGPSPLP